MDLESSDLTRIVELLRRSSTFNLVKEFLRERGLPFSAHNGDELYDRRLLPAVIDGSISEVELLDLLRDSEEFGRQHVLLYKVASPARLSGIRSRDQIKSALAADGRLDLLSKPRIRTLADLPGAKPEIVEVRWDSDDSLIIKIVEKREYTKVIREDVDIRDVAEKLVGIVQLPSKGRILAKVYSVEEVRAVSVFRLHASGILELRIYSHRDNRDYSKEAEALWFLVKSILDRIAFRELPLIHLKENLWRRRAELNSEVLFCNSDMTNENGTKVSMASGGLQETDLFADPAAVESAGAFIARSGVYSAHTVNWRKSESGLPSRNVMVWLSGALNEFTVTVQCNKRDYDHVFGRICELADY